MRRLLTVIAALVWRMAVPPMMHRAQTGNACKAPRRRVDAQAAGFHAQPQQAIGGPKHARRSAGITGPAATPVMAGAPVHIRGLLIRR